MTVVVNPATEATIATLDEAGVEETDAAVARARAAYPGWRAVSPADRGRVLRRLATLVEEHHEELSQIESRNAGKPISGARGEIGMVADVFHFYAGAVDKHHGATIPVGNGIDMTFREPLGVVGLIVPWNFPLNIASDRKSTRLNSSHTEIYTLSLHDALPISRRDDSGRQRHRHDVPRAARRGRADRAVELPAQHRVRSEEHTSELQSHRDLHSFPTRRSSDLTARRFRSATAST